MAGFDHIAGRKRWGAESLGVVEVDKEYNKGKIEYDLRKIQEFLTLGVQMSFGAVLFYCWLAEAQAAEADARSVGHQWFSIGVPIFPDFPKERYVACMRWFKPP
jgi:hypothetical protein